MLTARQEASFERLSALVTPGALAETVAFLVDIRSPTGGEAKLAEAVVARLRGNAIDAQLQSLDAHQANVFAQLPGSGGKPSLMLYSPTDTVTSDDPDEDLPWAAPEMAPEMRARALVRDGLVSGLGAQNPKGHAACAIVAVEIVARAGVPLAGTLMLGLGAGGMPTNARKGTRPNSGHGAGCEHMMQVGPKPDMAVIAKSGWAVSWEEVGLAWYEVRVAGSHTYVGSRHLLPYSNAIANAAKVALALEEWFPGWAETHRSGLVAPQGVVSYIEGGWERMPAFTPAVCRLRFDLRLSPRTTFEDADGAIAKALSDIAERHGLVLEWERIVGIPGTTTDPGAAIVQTCIEAWEHEARREHRPIAGLSGATDANILRLNGVPTARVGLPKVDLPGIDFQQGMNTVAVDDMVRLTRLLLRVAVATCID